MAKNRNNSIDSDFDLDANLDFDDFDFPELNVKDDRKPVIKVMSGIAKGAKSAVRDTAFLKRTIKDSLPKGYGQSMDLADKTTETIRSLYDESAREIKPAIKETKRVISKLIPKESKLVPKSVLAMIKRWDEEAKAEGKYGALSKDAQRESMVSSQLTDIFKAQMEQSVKFNSETEGKDRLKEGIEMSRHRELSSFLMRSSVSLDRIEKYQSNITLGFQKKTLELQFRQLFATQDLLQHAKEDAVKRDAILLAIAKNSSLPEAVKITGGEAKNQLSRNKFNESMHKGLFGGRDQMVEKSLEHVKNLALAKVKEATGGLRVGLGMAEMGEGSMGGDVYVKGGEIAGNMGVRGIGSWAGGKIKGALESGKFGKVGKGALNVGKKAEHFHENVGQKVNAFRKNKAYDYDDSLKGGFMRFAQSLIPGMGPDLKTEVFKSKDMESPYTLTRRTDKSINEVIPGYLSRILREVQVLRTGNEKIELTQYSFDQGKFTSKGKLEAAAFKDIISANGAKRTQGQLDKLIDQIDPTGKRLSPDARAELKKKLLTNSTEFNEANKENLGMYASYKDVKDNLADEIVPLMREFFDNLSGDKKVEFSRANNALADSVSDPRAAIQQQINLGNIQYLKKMGLVDKTGNNIDLKKVIEYMLDPALVKAAQSTAPKAVDPNKAAGNAFKSMASSLNPKVSVMGQAKESASDLKKKVMDVFAPGEMEPRMTAVKMQAGHYRDKITQAIITHQSMITGAVEDTSNGNNVVVEASDVSRLAYVNAQTKTLQAIDYIKKGGADTFAKHVVSPDSTAGKLLQLGNSKLQEAIGDVQEKVTDVYMTGEENPRLLAVKMKAGHYKDKLTGKAITHQSEINGEVVDENNAVVISAEDIPSLKVWHVQRKRFGPIRFVGRAAIAIAKGMWNFQKAMLQVTKFNFKVLGAAGRMGMSAVKGILGIGPGKVKDVYVGDEKNPRLYAARLKAGDYRIRATGERIYHQNDITGEIIDRDDQVVLSDEDMPKLKVYDSVLKMLNPFPLIGKILKGLGKGAWWAQQKLTKLSVSMLKGLGSMAKSSIGAIVRFVSKPQDVLVKGNTKPTLYGRIMKAGGYISALTGKVISLASDIDGAVLDENGQTALTDDEFKRGLLDVAGNPIKTGALGMVKKGLGALNKLLSRRVKLPMVQRGKATQALLKDKTVTIGDKTVILLTDIKNLFEKQFNPKKSMFGDSDGDGDRDGSYQDKMKNKVSDAEKLARSKGFLGGPAASKAADKKKANEEEGGISALDALDAASDAKDLLGGGRRKGGSRLGKLAKFGGKALGLAGATYGAYSAYDNIKQGNYGEAALDAAGAGVGVAMTGVGAGAIGTGLAATGGTLATVGGGLLALVSSPIVLGAAAVALGGFGAYKLFKFATKNNLSPYEKIRYVQYGFMKDQTSNVSKVFELENYLKGFLKEDESGLRLDEAKLSIKELLAPWGLDHKNTTQLELFFGWYQNRFKPVFLTHLTAIKGITGKSDLSGTDKLKGEDVKKFLDAARFSDGPYDYTSLPTLDKDTKVSNSSDVARVVEEAMKELTDGKSTDTKSAAGTATNVVAGAAVISLDAKGNVAVKDFDASRMSSPNNKLPNVSVAAVSTVSTSTMATVGKISALDAVRFKAYGLVEMDSDKVVGIHLLEKAVNKGVVFDGNNVASWKGNPIAILANLAGSFGIGEVYGKEANDWSVWFKNRFLPVYMGYLSGFKVFTGKGDAGDGAFALKPEQQLQLAKIIAGLKGIWSELNSPWPNYKLSDSSDVTKPNIDLLEDTAKKSKIEEDKKASTSSTSTNNTSTVKTAFKPPSSDQKSVTNGYQESASPDAEVQVKGSTGGASPSGISGNAGGIPLAGGAIVDGRNALAHLNIKDGVSLNRMNPAFLKNFYGMAEEYGMLTGKKVGINDAFRTYEEQVAAKKKYGRRAAEPGTSLHEFGLAMDIEPKTLDEMEKMGLMRKYGFTRPVGGEAWHMEPIGIQSDITGFKTNLNKAIDAVNAGLGKGGGGMGTVTNAPLYTRNADLSKSIMAAATTPNVDNKVKDATASVGAQNQPAQANTPAGSLNASSGSSVPSGSSTNPNIVRTSFSASADGESKPASGAFSSSNSPANIVVRPNNLPSDPTVKVPDAKGSGYMGFKDMISAAAKMVGVDPDILMKTAAIESGFDPSAKAKGSSASGLFQFTKDTWSAMMDKYGGKYGFSNGSTSPNDPKAASIMAAHYLKESLATLGKRIKRTVGATEAYIAHFLGAGGATTFLNALDSNPGTIGASLMPSAAKSNGSIFFDNGRPRTVSEIYSVLDQKVREKAKSFGLNTVDAPSTMMASNSASSTSVGKPNMPTLPNQPSGFVQASYTPPKPTVASQATNQSGSPLTDAYGFKPMQSAVATSPSGQPNQMNKEVMVNTENILGQQLEVQKQMLEVMSNIFGIMSSKPAGGASTGAAGSEAITSKPSSGTYVVPKAPVSVKRVMA